MTTSAPPATAALLDVLRARYGAAGQWRSATWDVIARCPCETGCPSRVQSPKCGNGNQPLAEPDAVRALGVVLSALDSDRDRG